MSRPKGSKNKPKITENIEKSKEEALKEIREESNIQAESTPIIAS